MLIDHSPPVPRFIPRVVASTSWKADSIMLHPSGVNEYLVFLSSPPRRPPGDSACGEQSRTEIPVGEGAKVAHGCRVCRKADDEKLAEYRRLRTDHRTVDVVGQCVGHRGQFSETICRSRRCRCPSHLPPIPGKKWATTTHGDAGSAADGCLYLECDELPHLLGCHAVGFGHDHHRRALRRETSTSVLSIVKMPATTSSSGRHEQ